MCVGTPNTTHNEIIFCRIKAFAKKNLQQKTFCRRTKAECSQHDLSNLQWINDYTTGLPSWHQSRGHSTHTNLLPLLHGRLATLHTFCHLTQTWGAHWWQMLYGTGPRGHKWPFGLSFFFFSPRRKELFIWRRPPMLPWARNGAGGRCCLSSEITFTTNELCLCAHERPSPCLSGREEDFRTTNVRLMPSTELNCRMASLLFCCHGDCLLLSRMNHR